MATKTVKKTKNVNLLPSEEFKTSVLGRVLKWALTTFRVTVIICEMIVMGAFLSRFWLDAKNSDLNEEIEVTKAQVEAYKQTEEELRLLQKRLLISSELYSQQKVSGLVETISKYMPSDVTLASISITDNLIQIKSNAFSEQSIVQFVSNLESIDQFDDVNLGQVSSATDEQSFISFTITCKIKG